MGCPTHCWHIIVWAPGSRSVLQVTITVKSLPRCYASPLASTRISTLPFNLHEIPRGSPLPLGLLSLQSDSQSEAWGGSFQNIFDPDRMSVDNQFWKSWELLTSVFLISHSFFLFTLQMHKCFNVGNCPLLFLNDLFILLYTYSFSSSCFSLYPMFQSINAFFV